MRVLIKFLLPTIAASILLSACGSSSHSSSQSTASSQAASSSSTSAQSAMVKTASSSSHGTILVNGQGLTLYRLTGERAGKLICTNSACLQVWHPLTVSTGSKPSGSVGSLGVLSRPDGTTQVTYKGMPLYTFAQDQAPGQTKGQGLKDVGTWTVLTVGRPKAHAAAPAPAAPSTQAPSTTQAPSSGGYGY